MRGGLTSHKYIYDLDISPHSGCNCYHQDDMKHFKEFGDPYKLSLVTGSGGVYPMHNVQTKLKIVHKIN